MSRLVATMATALLVVGSWRDSDVILCAGVVVAAIGYVGNKILDAVEAASRQPPS